MFIKFKAWLSNMKQKRKDIFSWLWEFSKKLVFLLSVYYFFQSLYVIFAIKDNPDSVALSTFITENNETFRVCIGGYLLKAGIENTIKIKNALYEKTNDIKIGREDEI